MAKGKAIQHISKPRDRGDAQRKQGTAKNNPVINIPSRAVIGCGKKIKTSVMSANHAAMPTSSEKCGA
jgi:hypothetical protein